MYSKMKVETGGLVKSFKPFVCSLSNEKHGLNCEGCFLSSHGLKKCTACGITKYCSVKCQREDWNIHKYECKCLQNTAPKIPLTSVRLLLRLVIKLKNDIGESDLEENDVWYRRFSSLMSHREDIQADQKRCEQFSQILATLFQLTQNVFALPPAAELLDMFGKMTTNSFTICDGEMQPLGVGIYLGASYMDHSCTPNAVVTFTGTTLNVRALSPIDVTGPTDIRISYIDLLPDSKERRESLREQYYFECTCDSCSKCDKDDLRGCVKCKDIKCCGYCLKLGGESYDFQSCSKCGGESYDAVALEKFQTDITRHWKQIKTAKDKKDADLVLKLCKEALHQHKRFLHPLSLKHTQIADAAFDACVDNSRWTEALDYGLFTVEPYSPVVGVQLMKIGKLQLYLQKLPQALQSLEQAESILCITHGRDSPIYTQISELLDQTKEELRVQHELNS